jgi:hypothetical protein
LVLQPAGEDHQHHLEGGAVDHEPSLYHGLEIRGFKAGRPNCRTLRARIETRLPEARPRHLPLDCVEFANERTDLGTRGGLELGDLVVFMGQLTPEPPTPEPPTLKRPMTQSSSRIVSGCTRRCREFLR